jgi:hypothetical protein
MGHEAMRRDYSETLRGRTPYKFEKIERLFSGEEAVWLRR